MTRTTTIADLLLGGLAAGMLTATAVGSAPSADATCISAFGLSGNPDCTSSFLGVAIAVGPSAEAHADGLLGTAFAFGANSGAFVNNGAVLNLAVGLGLNGSSTADGFGSVGLAAGPNTSVVVGKPGSFVNLAINLSPKNAVTAAYGIGNVAVNLLGGSTISAVGVLNTALNVGGDGNSLEAVGTLSSATNLFGSNNQVFTRTSQSTASGAFNIFGSGNVVAAGPGPLATAGSLGQTGQTVLKIGPGININNRLVIGGAAAVNKGTAAAARHAAGASAPRPAAATGASRNN